MEYVKKNIQDLQYTQNISEKNGIVQNTLQDIGQKNDPQLWNTFLTHICTKEPITTIKNALETFVDSYLLGLGIEVYVKLCDMIIKEVSSKNAGQQLNTVLFKIRLFAAEAKADQGKVTDAYQLLQDNIDISSSQESTYLARQFVKLAYFSFTNDEIRNIPSYTDKDVLEKNKSYQTGIEAYKRCGSVSKDIKDGNGLYLRFEYMIVDAMVNEIGCQWHKAADKYYTLSNSSVLSLDKQMYSKFFSSTYFLSRSICCAIVTPPNSIRVRLVSKLLDDNRVSAFSVKIILQKTFSNLLILPEDTAILHRAVFPPPKGTKINIFKEFFVPQALVQFLPLALLQQNVVSVSLLFDNITIKNLAEILKVKENEAMDAAYSLFSDETIDGKIDQVKGVLLFKTESTLKNWNSRIEDACVRINEVADDIHVLEDTKKHEKKK